MHRSGTSMLTNILGELGFFLGDPDEMNNFGTDNLKGFYERYDIIAENADILESLGGSAYNTDQLPTPSELSSLQTEELERVGVKKILSNLRKVSGKRPIVIKDPRLCLTLPFWVAEGGFTDYSAIFIYRKPIEVASSMLKRGDIDSIDQGIDLWVTYNRRALSFTERLDSVAYIKYSSMLAEPIQEFAKVVPLLKLPPDESLPSPIFRVVEPNLRNETDQGAHDKLFRKDRLVREVWMELERRRSGSEQITIPERVKKMSEILQDVLETKSIELKELSDQIKKREEEYRKGEVWFNEQIENYKKLVDHNLADIKELQEQLRSTKTN